MRSPGRSSQRRSRGGQRPLRDRRPRLEDVVAGSEVVFSVRLRPPDGLEAWKQVIERGYDGYVAKDEASVYEVGPTRRWLKVKQRDWTVAEDRLAAADLRGLNTEAPVGGPGARGTLGRGYRRRALTTVP